MKVKHHSSGFSRLLDFKGTTHRPLYSVKTRPTSWWSLCRFFLKRFSRLIHKIVKGCIELAKLTSYITYVRLRLRGMVVFLWTPRDPKRIKHVKVPLDIAMVLKNNYGATLIWIYLSKNSFFIRKNITHCVFSEISMFFLFWADWWNTKERTILAMLELPPPLQKA